MREVRSILFPSTLIVVLVMAGTLMSTPRQDPATNVRSGVFTSVVMPPSGFSLSAMTAESELIVEAHVQAVYPSEEIGTGVTHLETDALLQVDRVWKGPQPSPSQVVISQIGGSKAGFELVNADQKLMKTSEEYVLFLQKIESLPASPERTSTLKVRENIPRYEIYYRRFGLFQIVQNRIVTGNVSDFRSAFNSMPLADFRTTVGNLLTGK